MLPCYEELSPEPMSSTSIFVKLQGLPHIREFQPLFFRRVLWLAPLVAVFFWVSGGGARDVPSPEIPFTFLLALPLFFIARGGSNLRDPAVRRVRRTQLAVMIFLFALLWLGKPDPPPT